MARMMSPLAALIIAPGLLITPAASDAQPLDGTYVGTMQCGLLSPLTRPLKTELKMTVAGDRVTYEREILDPRIGRTGRHERGRGTLGPGGEHAERQRRSPVRLRGRVSRAASARDHPAHRHPAVGDSRGNGGAFLSD